MKGLSERERVEFVAKMTDYRDRFESSLDKVENIPGMMGLDVTNLRLSLGLSSKAEDMEEVHIEDVPWYELQNEDLKQSKSFGSVESMLRETAKPTNLKSSAKKKEPTMNDLYDALLQLLELTIVQVLQKAEEDDSVDVLLDPFKDDQLSQQQAMMNSMMMGQSMIDFMPFLGMNPMFLGMNPMMAVMNPMPTSLSQVMNPMPASMSQALNPMTASMSQALNPMMTMMDMPSQQPYSYNRPSMYDSSYRTPSSPYSYPYGGTGSGKRVPSEKEKIEKLRKKVMKKEKIGKKNVEERRKRSV